ncbi:MAG: hypothetical protein HOI45_08065 [Rhodospirillaceae bacterium]|jgi:hypothetical protein|nr:hypothetical protein [Rhodospirillaceae bacterium]
MKAQPSGIERKFGMMNQLKMKAIPKPLKKPVFTKLTASMTREQMIENVLAALKRSGIKVNMDG